MTCNICKKSPAMFHTFVAQLGQSVPVCPSCLASKTTIKINNFGLPVRVSGGRTHDDDIFSMFKTRSERICCDTCGHDLIDLQRTTKLGCSDCYTAFEKQLAPMINSIHGGGDV